MASRPNHPINILEFSKRVGLSTATVSRAFHEPQKLRPETLEKVMELAKKLHYFPNPSGRALVTGKSDIVGLIWPLEVEGADSRFAQHVLAALAQTLAEKDRDLLICPVDRRHPGTIEHARRTLLRARCDAWILLYPRHDDALIDALKNSGKPVVCLMGQISRCPSFKSVLLNQQHWIGDALRRLRAIGCKNVLFFGSRTGEIDHEERIKAFSKMAPAYFGSRFTLLTGWPPDLKSFNSILSSGKVDAIIAVDGNAASSALDACRTLGLRSPGDVKIVGISESLPSDSSGSLLSTYHQPLDKMTRCAVELAFNPKMKSRIFEAVFVARSTLPED